MKTRSILAFTIFGLACLLPGPIMPAAQASKATVIRFASLAPNGSSFMKVLKAWNRSLKKETNNKVEMRFYSGGSQGDERDFIRKIRAGQMDAAGVTTTGLGIVVRPVLVLSAPGLIEEYDQLGRVRKKLDAKFEQMFEDAGFKLLAWGDAGKNRLFSTKEFSKPGDIKSNRPWAWKDDPIFAEFLRVIGANPIRLGVPEVYPGLQTQMIDTVPASALAAVALQWYTRLKYVAKQNFGIIIGASIVKKDIFDQLTPAHQEVLVDTAQRAARALDKLVQRDDNKAYRSLLSRGLTEVDLSAHKAAWDKAADDTRDKLAGRVYSKALLDAVSAAAAGK